MISNGNGGNTQALAGVTIVDDNDIICGRGGLALKHPGNMAYRKIVGLNKELYATCLKTEKLRISKSIVAAIREINGRFLEREDGKTSSSLDEKDENGNPVTWKDIGDKRAVEKTSQALREGQPKLLKKLAQQQGDTPGMVPTGVGGGTNPMSMGGQGMNGHYNHGGMGAPHQPQMMSQFGHMQHNNMQQGIQNNNGFNPGMQGVGIHTYDNQQNPMPMQNSFQAQPRLSFTAQQQRPSITLASLSEVQTFSTFPRNSFVENNSTYGSGRHESNGHESWQDSWGSSNPNPLSVVAGGGKNILERSDSRDSWGGEDPMPLPYVDRGNNGTDDNEHDLFSKDAQKQLMTCLDVDGDHSSAGSRASNKRPSVKFQLQPSSGRTVASGMSSAMSLTSHLSELSIFSDALSLDSAMDAAQREADLKMLDEFEAGDMSIGTFESPDSSEYNRSKPRRSILRKSSKKWTSHGPVVPPVHMITHQADPGLMFTSTLDAKPGGVNAGTDISGVLGERRRSAVAFEIDVRRRRSSRMSMVSAMTEVSGMFKRDIGSILSIQSADFRELMADIDDDSSIEEAFGIKER